MIMTTKETTTTTTKSAVEKIPRSQKIQNDICRNHHEMNMMMKKQNKHSKIMSESSFETATEQRHYLIKPMIQLEVQACFKFLLLSSIITILYLLDDTITSTFTSDSPNLLISKFPVITVVDGFQNIQKSFDNTRITKQTLVHRISAKQQQRKTRILFDDNRPIPLCRTYRDGELYQHGYRKFGVLLSSTKTDSISQQQGQLNENANLKTKKKRAATKKVLYQKVVRIPAGWNDSESLQFLGRLIEYLQDRFEFPERLPVVYEKSIPDDTNNDSFESTSMAQTITTSQQQLPPVVLWDSPMSTTKSTSCMYVNVIGIVTSDEGSENTLISNTKSQSSKVPTMAMVVVEKRLSRMQENSQQSSIHGLFVDSEKRIIKHLDRGLDDFMSGKIKFTDSDVILNQQQSYEDALAEAFSDLESSNAVKTTNDYDNRSKSRFADGKDSTFLKASNILEAEIEIESVSSKDDLPDFKRRQEAALKTMAHATSNNNITVTNQKKIVSEDFAVKAAKAAVAQQATKKQYSDGLDFAVQAAKDAAAKRKQIMQQKEVVVQSNDKPTKESNSQPATGKSYDVRTDMMQVSGQRSPMIGNNGLKRNLFSSISTPADFLANRIETDMSQSTPSLKNDPAEEESSETFNVSSDTFINSGSIEAAPMQSSNVQEEEIESEMFSEETIAQSAADALDELADAGDDLSAEEMLSQIMKFSDQQDSEESPGSGFVDGAFKAAKNIFREQQIQREKQNGFTDTQVFETKSFGKLTPEDELRQMFQAGERLAESRITTTTTPNGDIAEAKGKGTTQQDIESLIESDKTISRYARVLDEELVELKVRINKSPDEKTWDGPIAANPLFDILSGPEVYDRNVDPETAVNWPGARSGTSTKNLRLPKELDVAIAQAKFAAEVLLSIKEEISENGDDQQVRYKLGDREMTTKQVNNFRSVVEEAVEIGLIDNPLDIISEQGQLQMVIDELWYQPEERFEDIVSNYKDLLLSDYFVPSIKVRCKQMAERYTSRVGLEENEELEKNHAKEREILGFIVTYAQFLVQQARALGAELEVQQLEIIRSICKVAMDPSHQTEEETSNALSDAVRDMRPMLDDAFVAYLKYAVAEEEGKLARAGLIDDPEHNQWMYVLKIVQQGVYAEIAKSINRYIDHIMYVLRMETQIERRRLLEELIQVMPTMDVRPFVQVVNNIVSSLGDGVKGDFDGITPLGEMTNKLLQLHRDTKELLPPDRIAVMSKDADDWVAQQKKRLIEQRGITEQRLKAAQETEHLDEKIESFGKRGEVDRFD